MPLHTLECQERHERQERPEPRMLPQKAKPQRVGRRWSPLGVCNPPPTEGAHGVLDYFIYVRDLSDKFDSRRQFQNVLDTPLYNLSPGGGGPPSPRAKFALSVPFRPLGSIFCTSKTCFKFCFEKTSKKVRKLMILASQNPPKTLPKCFQNRTPKKRAIFHRFLLEF